MTLLRTVQAGFERLLEVVVILLVAALTVLVVAGAAFRYAGSPLVWYDEVASVGLVWLTYYGSALAALKGAHIGFPGFVNAMPPKARVVATLLSELCVFFFFGVLTVTGLEVVSILGGSNMVSLPSVPLRLTQSVIPIGGALFVLAELLRLPELLREARGAGFVDHELKEALAHELPPGVPEPPLAEPTLNKSARP